MKTKTKLALAAVLVGVLAGAAYAAIMSTVYIDTSMRIKMSVAINVFDTDGSTPLTSIAFGDFLHGDQKFYPGGIDTIPSEYYFVNNTDEMQFYVGFNVSNPPDYPNVGFRMYIRKGNESVWIELDPINNPPREIYDKIIESAWTNPDPNTQFAHWYLKVYVGADAAFGDYSPSLVITAHDNATG